MKNFLRLIVLIAMLASLFSLPASAAGSPSRFVVVFNNASLPGDAAQVIAAAGGEMVRSLPKVGVAIAVSSDANFAEKARASKAVYAVGLERAIELAPNLLVEDAGLEGAPSAADSYYPVYQWDIRRVKADQVWPTNSGSHETVVAVIDTGVAWNHPDLAPNVLFAACYSSQAACNPYPSLSYHGTHVAGTIAAAFGGGRVVGVGPELGIAAYNVFEVVDGSVSAYDESIWAAMLDAADRGFDVINMSLGSYVIFPAHETAIWTAWNRVANYVNRMGVTIVASAGNGAADMNGAIAHIPSDLSPIVSVGASAIRPNPVFPQEGSYDVLAEYSNFGAAVDLVAPGGDTGPEGTAWPFPGAYYLIFSTYVTLNPSCAASASCAPGYAWAAGTSMASPHVAGAAGLLKNKSPELSPNQVEARLIQTAEALGNRQLFGHGLLDVYALLNK